MVEIEDNPFSEHQAEFSEEMKQLQECMEKIRDRKKVIASKLEASSRIQSEIDQKIREKDFLTGKVLIVVK
jgi:hypothetical protein